MEEQEVEAPKMEVQRGKNITINYIVSIWMKYWGGFFCRSGLRVSVVDDLMLI